MATATEILQQYLGKLWAWLLDKLKWLGIPIEEFFSRLFQAIAEITKVYFLEPLREAIITIFDTANKVIYSFFSSFSNFLVEKSTWLWNVTYNALVPIFGPVTPAILTIMLVIIAVALVYVIKAILVFLIP